MTIDIYGDYVLVQLTDKKYNKQYGIFECTICHRKKEVSLYHMQNGRGISHESCVHLIDKNNKYYHRFHSIWNDMRKRTTNSHVKQWEDYGGRGISSEEYRFFIDFYDDLFECYVDHVCKFGEKDTTLDRINVNDGYKHGNCRWSTRREQNINTRRRKGVKAYNLYTNAYYEFESPSDCADTLELNQNSIYNVLNKHSKSYKGYYFEYIQEEVNGNQN